MSISTTVLGIIRDRPETIFTPRLLQHEALKMDIPLSHEYAKKILQRLHKRGFLVRVSRGQYIFSPQGDRMSHFRGQRGTESGGISHSNRSNVELNNPASKCDKGTCHIPEKRPSIFRRMVAVLTCYKLKGRTVSPRDFTDGIYLQGVGNPETKRRYFYRLVRLGVLEKVGRGRYRVDTDRAYQLLERDTPRAPNGTPTQKRDSIITVSHHFRIKKPVPLTEEEFSRIARYIWSRDPIKDYVNGVYLEVYPTGRGDRSHGVRLVTPGATFHITYSYRKNLAKVMIYPRGREGWTWYAERLFGEEFARRAIKIGISSHFGLNLAEVQKVLFEGDEIRVTVNRSDFGSGGDLEFEGVSDEGAEYVRKRLLGEVRSIAREVDILESLKSAIGELSARIHMLELDGTGESIRELKREVEEIKEHVEEHSRALTLILRSINIWRNSGEVEGYA